jgi:hypothetical protein
MASELEKVGELQRKLFEKNIPTLGITLQEALK